MDYKDTNTATHTAWTELSASHTDTFQSTGACQGVFIIPRLFSGLNLVCFYSLMFYTLTAVAALLKFYLKGINGHDARSLCLFCPCIML